MDIASPKRFKEEHLMNPMSNPSSKPYRRYGNAGLEFDPKAREVAILDRNGRAVWKQSATIKNPIRWNGSNTEGNMVQTGDYICRIVYPDDKITYMPFVYMKPSH